MPAHGGEPRGEVCNASLCTSVASCLAATPRYEKAEKPLGESSGHTVLRPFSSGSQKICIKINLVQLTFCVFFVVPSIKYMQFDDIPRQCSLTLYNCSARTPKPQLWVTYLESLPDILHDVAL